MSVRVGQVWRDNDPRMSRLVEVLEVEANRAKVRRIPARRRSPATWVNMDRFGSNSSRGFTLVKDKGQ